VPFFVIWPEAFTRNTPPLEVLEPVLLDDDEDVELLLEEVELLEDEVELLLEEVELLEDDEVELELLDELELPLIEPAEAVSVTRSSRAPSSRLTIRSVWLPAARLLKVVGVMVP
jgi:hypothetical protein